MSSRIRLGLVAVSLLALGVAFVTLERAADSSADSQLYASIARSRQIYGTGVPSALRHSPYATDHVRFYGRVFFTLAARSFDVFGFSKWSLRLVSLTGALLVASAGGLLALALTGSWDRSLWAITLLMLAPEVMGRDTYSTLPLFAIVIALPIRCFDALSFRAGRHVFRAVLAVLLVGDGVVAVRRYVPVAATWAARDPVRLVAWLRDRIRPGADVVGPVDRYLFVAEEAGARYSWTSAQSWADWARWVPVMDPRPWASCRGPVPSSRAI